jgi:acyl-coenzyme A thioesterase PaaI-like protein
MAAGVALRTLKLRIVTVEVSTSYFAPVPLTGELTATARVVHEGRKLLHAEVDVHDSAGVKAAGGRGVFFIIGEDTGEY